MNITLYIFIGLVAGVMSGLFGVGGAVLLVPAFVFLLGMSQHQAQGTALAVLLPPIFIFAVIKYYQHGFVQVKLAMIVALAFALGAYGGAVLAQIIPDALLRRAFGIFLILMGLRMVWNFK
jgi:uncharacterized protein